jgi:uncharacterized protein YndB with AHSA1/START domain
MIERGLQPIRCAIGVAGTPADVFDRFVRTLGRWWPLPYTYAEDLFETAEIEAHAGGRWFERSLDGSETDWGEVRAFEPGRRLVLSYAVSPLRAPEPPERASEVEIRFAPASNGTRLELEHRDFGKHGEGADRLREGMASRQGWPLILASFAREARYPG